MAEKPQYKYNTCNQKGDRLKVEYYPGKRTDPGFVLEIVKSVNKFEGREK